MQHICPKRRHCHSAGLPNADRVHLGRLRQALSHHTGLAVPDTTPASGGRFGSFCSSDGPDPTANPQSTSSATTSVATTPVEVVREECLGGTTRSSGASCSCGSDCFSCYVYSDGRRPVCRLCSNSYYLYQGVCLESCEALENTLPLGTTPFGRHCAFGEFCISGLAASGVCSCTSNCAQCLLRRDMNGLSVCSLCEGGRFLYEGLCYTNCDNFPNTVATGSGTVGRECVARP